MYHKEKIRFRKKRKYDLGREPAETKIEERKVKKVRTKGGGAKIKLLSDKYAHVLSDGKYIKCEILTVVLNPAGRDLTRRNIITKGAILKVKTPDGQEIKAKVTSRPGQVGNILAIPVRE
ncbi:MAG: 30S ribosomal protein S8e [Candidatus Altiarchaeota archaeon]